MFSRHIRQIPYRIPQFPVAHGFATNAIAELSKTLQNCEGRTAGYTDAPNGMWKFAAMTTVIGKNRLRTRLDGPET